MPYITQERRKQLLQGAEEVEALNPGELNFVLTDFILCWIKATGGISYTKITEVTGVLENVKQEFYRRVAVPYEDHKKEENGDVY